MKCVVGIDLGSTTTKAVLLDETGQLMGRGITNSRSNYGVACAVAREEALTAARFTQLQRAIAALDISDSSAIKALTEPLQKAFRLELYLEELVSLKEEILKILDAPYMKDYRQPLGEAAEAILEDMRKDAPKLFLGSAPRRSDFFRDIAGAAFTEGAERLAQEKGLPFERLLGLFDRAILDVETRLQPRNFGELLLRGAQWLTSAETANEQGNGRGKIRNRLVDLIEQVAKTPIEEIAFVGTGYGRQTLPFPKDSIRSEILCHGRGAHRVFPGTRTVLDIGGQDTKAIQVDGHGVVTSFQMNDRCAAGCGRYLGYIADELNLGLHELGPLALGAKKKVKVNSTCTVFAGAELRERLALGQRREDILAGLHRAIMLRAMSLLARSGGIDNEFTFTGGVCKNPMATKILGELVQENYGADIALNIHPDSIYMGALGGALFALDDVKEGRAGILPGFAKKEVSS